MNNLELNYVYYICNYVLMCCSKCEMEQNIHVKDFRHPSYVEGVRRLVHHSLSTPLETYERRIASGFQALFIPPKQPDWISHPFNVLQGTSRCIRRRTSFSARVVKFNNFYLYHFFRRRIKCQLDSIWFDLLP